jgi:hypothetical protein
MFNELLIATALLLSVVGCGYYALSQHQHWKAVTKPSVLPLKQTRLQVFSLFALSTSLVLYIVEEGIEFALLLWPLSLGLGIFSVGMILTFRPTLLRILI